MVGSAVPPLTGVPQNPNQQGFMTGFSALLQSPHFAAPAKYTVESTKTMATATQPPKHCPLASQTNSRGVRHLPASILHGLCGMQGDTASSEDISVTNSFKEKNARRSSRSQTSTTSYFKKRFFSQSPTAQIRVPCGSRSQVWFLSFSVYVRAKCRRGRSCLSPRFRSGLACRRHFVWWKMVGTRWESSKRPLFIRTVWKDGHHHVVLQKDEEGSARTARSSRRNPSSSRSGKKTTPPSKESSPFKVPSVKLFLASLRHIKNDTRLKKSKTEMREFAKSAITVDVIPRDSVRYNDLNKQVSFKSEKRTKLTTKSHSVDVHNFESDSSILTPPPFSYDNYCMDQFNATLSERVMIWLDLAIQNQKQFRNVDLKQRVVTAQACPIVERTKFKTPEKSKRIVEERKADAKNDDVPVERQPLVTSQMECVHDVRVNQDAQFKVRSSTAKRQLHIFLPLPKKCSESGSFLSSKSGSMLSKK